MRRLLIFLLVLTVPVGFLIGTHKAVGAMGDDVRVEQLSIYGDPERLEGLQVQLRTTCGEHMCWYTDYTAGQSGSSETRFRFFRENRQVSPGAMEKMTFSLNNPIGVGASTSGGEGFRFEGEGMPAVLRAVAEETPAGQTVTKVLDLGDYLDCYPLSYEARIFIGSMAIDEVYGEQTSFEGDESTMGSYETWTQLFRFPLREGSTVEVSVEKDLEGAVRTYSFNMLAGDQVSFLSSVTESGMYFAPVFADEQGRPLSTGQFPQGYGLYYIPFKFSNTQDQTVYNSESYHHATFDFDGMELVYAISDQSQVVFLEADRERGVLHMLTLENETYVYSALDLNTGMQRRLEITATEEGNYGVVCRFYAEQELLLMKGSDWLALVDTSEDAAVEFVADWPEDLPHDLPEAVLYRNGVLYMTSFTWTEAGRGFYLAACDGAGLGCFGEYRTNLQEPFAFASGKGYLYLDQIQFGG